MFTNIFKQELISALKIGVYKNKRGRNAWQIQYFQALSKGENFYPIAPAAGTGLDQLERNSPSWLSCIY